MKSVFINLILILFCLPSYSQTVLDTDGLNNLDNVFLYSLKEYCKTLDSIQTKVIYVRGESFIGNSWPKRIESFEIVYLYTHKEYKRAVRKNGGNVTVIGISPLNFIEGKFYVSIIPFYTTYSWWKNNINLSNGGGLAFYFNYSSDKGGLIYSEKEWHGI